MLHLLPEKGGKKKKKKHLRRGGLYGVYEKA